MPLLDEEQRFTAFEVDDQLLMIEADVQQRTPFHNRF